MEFSPLKRIDGMPTRQRFYEKLTVLSKRWWLFYGIGMGILFLSILDWYIHPAPSFDVTAVTMRYADLFPTPTYWRLAGILGGVIVGAGLFAVKKRSLWYGLGLFFLLIVIFLAFEIAAIRANPPKFETLKPMQAEQSGGYVYRLLRYEKWLIDRPDIYYNLYRCDTQSIVCDRLYQSRVGMQIIDLGKDARSPGRLEFFHEDILLIVEGEVVYRASLDALPQIRRDKE